jgi:hypothetical protein
MQRYAGGTGASLCAGCSSRHCKGMEHQRGGDNATHEWRIPTVSATLRDGGLVELVYDPERNETAFIVAHDGEWQRHETVALDESHHLVPYSPNNNLIRNRVVLLAAEPEEYDEVRYLVARIRSFIHRYVTSTARLEFLID